MGKLGCIPDLLGQNLEGGAWGARIIISPGRSFTWSSPGSSYAEPALRSSSLEPYRTPTFRGPHSKSSTT